MSAKQFSSGVLENHAKPQGVAAKVFGDLKNVCVECRRPVDVIES